MVYSKERGLVTLKMGVNFDIYKSKYPSAIVVTGRKPTVATMERWVSDGICKSIDGCTTEPDGYCEHDMPSWLIALKLI